MFVSKTRRRFEDGAFDLDLSYINDRVIGRISSFVVSQILAMGFPSKSFEGLYRHKLSEVRECATSPPLLFSFSFFFFPFQFSFLDTLHGSHYLVFNLCEERTYDPAKFHGNGLCPISGVFYVQQSKTIPFPFTEHPPWSK